MKTLPIWRWLIGQGQTITQQQSATAPRQSKASLSKKSLLLLICAVILLTGAVGQRFYQDPKLGVGTPAPQTITAPAAISIEDTEATQAMRKAARRGALPMLMVDQQASKQIAQELKQWLSEGDTLRTLAGPFPFIQTFVLSTATQLYLRRAPEAEWRMTVDVVAKQKTWPPNQRQPAAAEKAIAELRAYRNYASAQNWSQLIDTVTKSRQQYQRALAKSQSPTAADALLLNLSDQTWRAVKKEIPQATQRILVQGIPPGLPESVVKDAVKVNISSLAPSVQPLAMQTLLGILRPNLTIDLDATRQHAERVAQEVQPVILTVQKGEVIVRQGEPITREAFTLLDHFELSRRGINWLGLIGVGVLVSGAVGSFWITAVQVNPRMSQQDYVLVLLLTLSAPLLTWTVGISYNSLPAIGLLIGSFYGSVLGAAVVGLSTVLLSVGINSGWVELLVIAVPSLVAGVIAGWLRSREELALLGGGVALTQGVTYLILSGPTGLAWYSLLGGAALQGLTGLGWSVIALGISPYLERLFDLVTPIRLAELSNPNRPTLKRLALEAPGTFQHTLFVATLAEAAARNLGCNVELVRAGTLYHDIGKLHDPLSFIENQMGGPNKHDTLNDPWRSAAIIKKHVTEGLVMARKCHLPRAIQSFIAEHHGTTQIAYFYYQAQKQAELSPDSSVQESDFRYAGPIPQSKETAIVMLADSCEAALRSLKEASPEATRALINKIFKARWQDNQLVDSRLTQAEISRMVEVFVQVWQQFNHKRIRYPSASLSITPKMSSG